MLKSPEVDAPTKRKRGRPPTKGIKKPAPAVAGSHSNRLTAFDPDHNRIEPYRYLLKRIFKHPKTKRYYHVVQLDYHPRLGVIAYRRALDDDPPEHDDDRPWPVIGEGGIVDLVHDYTQNHGIIAIDNDKVPWPTNEEEMRQLQLNDPSLQPVIRALLDRAQENEYFAHSPTKAFYLATTDKGPGALRIMDTRDPSHVHQTE
jgi:hypothetical protein